MAKITDLREYRKEKKRQERIGARKKFFSPRNLLRFLILLLVIGAVCAFFYFTDREEIRTYIRENITGTSTGTGYPLSLGSKNARHLRMTPEGPVVLTETNVQFFDHNAKLLQDIQHGYKSPCFAVNGEYALLYDQGADSFQVCTENGVVYTKKSKETILTGGISGKGKAAIATARTAFGSSLVVYGRTGEVAFEWYTTEGYITCVDLNEDRALVGVISTSSQGTYQSSLYYFDFKSSEPVCKVNLPEEMVYDCALSGGGTLWAVTDQNFYQLDRDGDEEERFSYDGKKLVVFDLTGNCAALSLADSLGEYRQELSVFRSPENCTLDSLEIRQPAWIRVSGSQVILLEGGMIRAVESGSGDSSLQLVANDNDRDAAFSGGSLLYVLSTDEVSRHGLGEREDTFPEENENTGERLRTSLRDFGKKAKAFFLNLFWRSEKETVTPEKKEPLPEIPPAEEEEKEKDLLALPENTNTTGMFLVQPEQTPEEGASAQQQGE